MLIWVVQAVFNLIFPFLASFLIQSNVSATFHGKEKMSTRSRIFLVVATLTITCLVLSHQHPIDCERNRGILDSYMDCLRSLGTSQRYGKRSPPNRSPLLKKLHPRLFQDFTHQPSRNLENLQEFYQLLEQDSD